MSGQGLTVRTQGSLAVAGLPADVDVVSLEHIREGLASLIASRPGAIVVDMTATRFCDSAGVAALVRLSKQAAAAQVPWRVAVSGAVLRVMQLLGADQVMEVHPSLAAALGDERQQPSPPG